MQIRKLDLLALVMLALVPVACQSGPGRGGPKRVALVIGNSAYRQASPLKNPVNDANAIAASLSRLGWDVMKRTDLTVAQVDAESDQMSRHITGADAVIFYYAGHALQINGKNYLVPVDFDASVDDLTPQLVNLDNVLADIQVGSQTNIVILDSCRNNPWKTTLSQRIAKGRSVTIDGDRGVKVIGRGMAEVKPRSNSLICFSTFADQIALDGTGKHSPYTGAILRHIPEPGLEVMELFRKVRADVEAETGGKQIPQEWTALTKEVYFRTKAVKRPPAP